MNTRRAFAGASDLLFDADSGALVVAQADGELAATRRRALVAADLTLEESTGALLVHVANPVPDGEYGDGSDGDKHVTADQSMTQAEYNLTALTIDAGKVWTSGDCATVGSNLTVIRCQTPIVLNGAIRAGKSGMWINTCGARWENTHPGFPPTSFYDQDSGDFFQVPGMCFPIPAGGSLSAAYKTMHVNGSTTLPGLNLGTVNNESNGDSALAGHASLIGREQMWRYCAGGSGARNPYAVFEGGAGAAAIILIAPAIIGDGVISANGEDGQAETAGDTWGYVNEATNGVRLAFTGILHELGPLVPGALGLNLTPAVGDPISFFDDGNGHLSGENATGTIDYAANTFTLTFTAGHAPATGGEFTIGGYYYFTGDGSGGGGGGYIEVCTRIPLTAAQKLRCTANGGAAGGVLCGAGGTGVVKFYSV